MSLKLNSFVLAFLFLAACLPSSAQERAPRNTSDDNESVYGRCDQKIFTKVAILPSLSVPAADFADSIKAYLETRSIKVSEGRFILSFIVLKSGGISELIILRAPAIAPSNTIKDAVWALRNLWKPAIQNDYEVCSYVKLALTAKNDALDIQIYQ